MWTGNLLFPLDSIQHSVRSLEASITTELVQFFFLKKMYTKCTSTKLFTLTLFIKQEGAIDLTKESFPNVMSFNLSQLQLRSAQSCLVILRDPH